MSRREKLITIQHGRDQGKAFLIREMDAFSCEEWARGAISAVHRAIQHSDAGVMLMLSESLREAFAEPELVDIPPPQGVPNTHPAVEKAREQANEEVRAQKEGAREATPTQMVAALGLALFLRLPLEEQKAVLQPLWECICYRGPHGDVRLEEQTRLEIVEDPRTVVTLRREAFGLHTDFFMPVVPCLYRRITQAGATFPLAQ
ncbi:hypothetical protein [Entomobacter blattae]|uniref:Uncharacterized protein n=1 Tax=Entomobacter blattae TaxID=2762277 RepID=A0A7H1NR72_9PROT|nr:hypothetical protein [Entomobacter blattae]QNT78282.1 hypothetical protein JGUZn3_10540 [Entomobacter blattae]